MMTDRSSSAGDADPAREGRDKNRAPRFERGATLFLAIVRIAASVLCALTLAAYLGRLGWFFDVWSHFRVQYLLALAVCLVLLAVLRDRLFLVAAGACFVVNAAEIVPWYFGANAAKADEDAPRRDAAA